MTIRGSGWRVLAPPSMAIPRVLALFATLTSVEVGSNSPGWSEVEREKRKLWEEHYLFIFIYLNIFNIAVSVSPFVPLCIHTYSFVYPRKSFVFFLSAHTQAPSLWIYTFIKVTTPSQHVHIKSWWHTHRWAIIFNSFISQRTKVITNFRTILLTFIKASM